MKTFLEKFGVGMALLLLSLPGFAREGTFHGKYMAIVDHEFFGEVGLKFLLNAKDEIKPLEIKENDVWEETSSSGTDVKRTKNFNPIGPFTEHLTVGFTYGSQEDGMASYVTIAWLGDEGEKKLTVLSSMTLYEDDPNRMSNAYKDNVTLFKWNTSEKRYVKLPKL